MPIEIKNREGRVITIYPANTLIGADLRNLDLTHVKLEGMDCTGAFFDNSILVWAHCRRTIFINASFRNTDMLHFQGPESNCEGADWEDVAMERANFTNAYLLNGRNWNKKKRDYLNKFNGTMMPDGRMAEV